MDAWQLVGQPSPGFSVVRNLLVGRGVERGGLEPFDFLRAMDGRLLESGREIHAEVRRHAPGTSFHYLINRRGRLVEADIVSKTEPAGDFDRFLLEGLLPGLRKRIVGFQKAFKSWNVPAGTGIRPRRESASTAIKIGTVLKVHP